MSIRSISFMSYPRSINSKNSGNVAFKASENKSSESKADKKKAEKFVKEVNHRRWTKAHEIAQARAHSFEHNNNLEPGSISEYEFYDMPREYTLEDYYAGRDASYGDDRDPSDCLSERDMPSGLPTWF